MGVGLWDILPDRCTVTYFPTLDVHTENIETLRRNNRTPSPLRQTYSRRTHRSGQSGASKGRSKISKVKVEKQTPMAKEKHSQSFRG
jgi:hypothetical protein